MSDSPDRGPGDLTRAPAARPTVGVLALQGDFDAHLRALDGIATARLVRTHRDLSLDGDRLTIDGLIMPGGESTTMIRLLKLSGLWDGILRAGADGLSIYGSCAGAILLAREVEDPMGVPAPQESLGLLDATVRRNAYGRQVDSFETEIESPLFPGRPLPVVCIRAPRFVRVGPSVEILLAIDGEPLWVRQGTVWATAFHPELTGDRRVHQEFVRSIAVRTR